MLVVDGKQYNFFIISNNVGNNPLGVVLNGVGQVNTTQNRFEYQDKEKEGTFDLNRINLGARTYNPATGRMDGVDAMSDIMSKYSPYQSNFNNPIQFIDPDGNESKDVKDFTYTDGYGTYSSRNSTGSIDFSGAYKTTGDGDEDGDKNKGKDKSPKSASIPIGVTGTLTLGQTLGRALPSAGAAAASDGPSVIGDAIGAGILIGVTADYYRRKLNNKVYVTYTKTNFRTGQVYVGRTSGEGNKSPIQVVKERDYGHKYWKSLGFGDAVVDRFLYGGISALPIGISEGITISAYSAIRGREQDLYNFYNNKGLVANRILPISPYNPFRFAYLKASEFTFGKLK